MTYVLLFIMGIFAVIGIIYTCTTITKVVLWVVKYRETIEAYAKLIDKNKEEQKC